MLNKHTVAIFQKTWFELFFGFFWQPDILKKFNALICDVFFYGNSNKW